MYQDRNLHIPRRPWSPDEYAASSSFSPATGLGQHARQREPSDSSVEALDLVDYAGTLRRGIEYDPYAAVTRAISPPRPFSAQSHEANSIAPPPSLYTGSSAPSSQAPDYSSVGGSRRPILHSIPDPVHSFRHYNHNHHHSLLPNPYSSHEPDIHPYSHEQDREERMEFGALEDDFDLQKFPSWSRNWFKHHSRLPPELDLAEPYADPYYDRDLLPWSSRRSGRSEYAPVSPGTREERLKKLQKEFGSSSKQPWANGRVESDNMIGSVDEKGRLITGGRKKRISTRVGQALMVLIAGGVSIYAALFIKVTNPTNPPPPAGRFGTWGLYVLSVITLLAITYVFALQPCCCPGNRKDGGDPFTAGNGMMVLPVGSGGMNGKANQKKNKKWAKKHKGMMAPPQQDIQVNLIVDPQMLKQMNGNGDAEEEDDDRTAPDEANDEDRDRTIRPQRPRRRGWLRGREMERQWEIARSRLKIHVVFDTVFMLLWGAEFVLILIGPRCPSGDFNGWCNAFNLATAASCFLILLFGLSVFFGVRDLHASKISPRQRT